MGVAGLMLANPYLLLAFASLSWSGKHIIGRAIAGHVPPIGLSTDRWLVPTLGTLVVARPHLRRDWLLIKPQWRFMLRLGLTGGALFSALQYVGLQYTIALNVSVLNSLTPVFIVVAGTLMFRDRIAIIQVLGIATSLIGVVAAIPFFQNSLQGDLFFTAVLFGGVVLLERNCFSLRKPSAQADYFL